MSFFDEQKEQSEVKSNIVYKYFGAWASVIINAQKKYKNYSDSKVAYIDLFAGPGRYKDGTKSTPVRILEMAIENDDFRKRLVSVFNDKDDNNTKSLEKAIKEIDGIERLTFYPEIWNEEVGDNIVSEFEKMNLVPTLFFVDPWGYKGLSLRLVNSVLKDWGCDALFFFNYNRINMGLGNDSVREHMNALFGDDRTDTLREKITDETPENRELFIVEELCQALKQYGTRFVLPFRFINEKGNRTSHHLIFVSKAFKGYELMKEIMAKESSSDEQGVASFEYNPADSLPKQTLLFQLSRPLDDLKKELIQTYSGKVLSTHSIYEDHNVDTPYIKKNYKDALRSLFDEGLVEAVSKSGKPPRKNTFADTVTVTFK